MQPIIPVTPVVRPRPVSGSSSAGKVKVEQEAASSVKVEAAESNVAFTASGPPTFRVQGCRFRLTFKFHAIDNVTLL